MQIRTLRNREYILCAYRKRYVRLTPEEWVRQHVLQTLEQQYAFPHHLIGVEVPIEVCGKRKRCDAIVYDTTLQPLVLLEFKAQNVAISRAALDQAAVYNRTLQVPYLIWSNGQQTVVLRVDNQTSTFLQTIPSWNQLSH